MKNLTAAAVIAAFVATPALSMTFAEYDKDGDGNITEAEYTAGMAMMKEKGMMNTDNDAALEPYNAAAIGADGVLTRNELYNAFNGASDDDVKQMDTNGDGTVTLAEMKAHLDPKVDPNVAAVADADAGVDETQTGNTAKGD